MKIMLDFRLFEALEIQLGQLRYDVDKEGFIQLCKKWIDSNGFITVMVDTQNGTMEVCEALDT